MSPRRYQIIGGGSAFASGGVTNNVVPKSNGAGQLADSSITDNGTTVSTTEPIVVPDTAGSGVPSVKGATAATGLYLNGAIAGLVSTTNGWFATGSTAATAFQVPVTGIIGWSSSGVIGGAGNDTFIGRDAAGIPRVGQNASATPTARTFQIGESSRGGTDSNVAGSGGSIRPGVGTGTGLASKLAIQRNLVGTTGTAAQTQSDAAAIGQSKTLSNTSATAQTIATITLGSNAGGGASGSFTIVATDGTNFDSETQSFNVSFVNKAGAITVGGPVITATSAANNSGSATLGITAVANGNNIDIKVTPVFTTIVPTTVTLYPVISHSTNTVTFA